MKKGFCENESCGEFRALHKSKKDGRFVCVNCHNKDPYYHKVCAGAGCNKLRKAVMRITHREYELFCPNCGRKGPVKEGKCRACDTPKKVVRVTVEHFCRECYEKSPYRVQKCSNCGKPSTVDGRDPQDNPLCGSCCNQALYDFCGKCGHFSRTAVKSKGENTPSIGVCCWQRARRKAKRNREQKE